MVGDFDAVLAVDPTILKHSIRAAKEVLSYATKRKISPMLDKALQQDVIDSGQDLYELSDINRMLWAKSFTKKKVTIESLYNEPSRFLEGST